MAAIGISTICGKDDKFIETHVDTIVGTNSREKTGYPTQKPLGVLERLVRVHTEPGDVVLDCFAGSGTAGEAAAKHGRGFILVDDSPAAVEIMTERLRAYDPEVTTHAEPAGHAG